MVRRHGPAFGPDRQEALQGDGRASDGDGPAGLGDAENSLAHDHGSAQRTTALHAGHVSSRRSTAGDHQRELWPSASCRVAPESHCQSPRDSPAGRPKLSLSRPPGQRRAGLPLLAAVPRGLACARQLPAAQRCSPYVHLGADVICEPNLWVPVMLRKRSTPDEVPSRVRCFIHPSGRPLAQAPIPARWQRRLAVHRRTPRA
jgi:hypothetical protein